MIIKKFLAQILELNLNKFKRKNDLILIINKILYINF